MIIGTDLTFVCDMPNGHGLYRKADAVGGFNYYSDETGVMTFLWSTSTVSADSVQFAIVSEAARERDAWRAVGHEERIMIPKKTHTYLHDTVNKLSTSLVASNALITEMTDSINCSTKALNRMTQRHRHLIWVGAAECAVFLFLGLLIGRYT